MSLAVAILAAACDDSHPSRTPGGQPRFLSEHALFADAPAQVAAEGVVPYTVNSALYADDAAKWRFLRLPPGEAIQYDNEGAWTFPEGTTLVKTFGYYRGARDPALGFRLLETRLLTLRGGTWVADIYIWNQAQTEAEHFVAGKSIDVTWVDDQGRGKSLAYRVPNTNQCESCHGFYRENQPLGPTARQLNRSHDAGDPRQNQLDFMESAALFAAALPPPASRPLMPDPYGTAPLDDRARAYLDANCAHCHRPGGGADSSGLDLRWGQPLGARVGVCKAPVAAGPGTGGRRYVIVPGRPDESIFTHRMATTDPGQKMPELPTQTADERGLALITEWIAAMPPRSCTTP